MLKQLNTQDGNEEYHGAYHTRQEAMAVRARFLLERGGEWFTFIGKSMGDRMWHLHIAAHAEMDAAK